VSVPLNIRIGFDIAHPILYFIDNNALTIDGYASVDLDEKFTVTFNSGYSDYGRNTDGYDFSAKGIYFKPGIDINLLKPQISAGKYWGGIGLRYGVSAFTYETTSFTQTNYWGNTEASIPQKSAIGHYLEVAPGFNAKITNWFTMGWRVSMSKLLYSGGKDNIRPLYIPGYGQSDKGVSFGASYYLSFSFSYKTIKAKYKEDNAGAGYEKYDEPKETTDSNSLF